MDIPETTLEILTLGRFSISVDGKPVATDWPNETVKIFFCSLLSPLDLYITWDRICRAILGAPDTRVRRRRLEETFIRPLNSFLVKELGFTLLVTGRDGIRIEHHGIHVDAIEFYDAVIEALRLLSIGSNDAACAKISLAESLYVGNYLPGISGKIIDNTRNELESLYRTAIMDSGRHDNAGYNRPKQHFTAPVRRV